MPEETTLTNKLKILRNPSKKSARDLLNSINKPNYDSTITNKGEVMVRIDKKGVPLSLNVMNLKRPNCSFNLR
jgi:hypothetical protein